MDFCAPLLLTVLGVLAVAAVGHGVWLLLAALFRALFAEPSPSPRGPERDPQRRSVRVTCQGCGTPFFGGERACPACGLDPESPRARELRDLAITSFHLEALVKHGELDAAVGDQVQRSVQSRQATLRVGWSAEPPRLEDSPRGLGEAAVPVAAAVWKELNHLLASSPDLQDLSFPQRQQALAWYRQLDEAEVGRLSLLGLLALARLLKMAGLTSRSLRVYKVLLKKYRAAPEAGVAALEAAQLAFRDQQLRQARWFLEQTRGHSYSPTEQQEIERLTAVVSQLPEPVAEEVPGESPAEAVSAAAGASAIPPPAPKVTRGLTPPARQPAPAAPRRSWGEMLAGFMEERNILWGELIGGLLIVGCSIALVISLWRTLEENPYFPFLLFTGITAALFGAGLYTLSHWKLEATSRGFLVIATLLTPLTFLILTQAVVEVEKTTWLALATEIGTVIGLTFLVYRSARILVGTSLGSGFWRADWLLTLAVMSTSASQLLVPRWLDLEQPRQEQLLLLSLVPVILTLLSVAPVWLSLQRRPRLDGLAANSLFVFLGLTTFAVGVALGFLVYWRENLETLQYLAVPIALAVIPLVACGTLVQRKLDQEPVESRRLGFQPDLGPPSGWKPNLRDGADAVSLGLSPEIARLVGTILALAGMAIMIGCLALAWPRLAGLIAVGLINAGVLSAVALGYRWPLVHGPALLGLTAAYLTAFHGLLGNLAEETASPGRHLLGLFGSADSGSALVVLAVLLAVVSEMCARTERREDSLGYLACSGGLALLAMILVGQESYAFPERIAVVLGVCALGGWLVNTRWRWPQLSGVAALLFLLSISATLFWLTYPGTVARLWTVAFLVQATVLLLACLILLRVSRRPDWAWLERAYVDPLAAAGLLGTGLAVLTLPFAVEWDWLWQSAGCALWLSALWLLLAWTGQKPGLFTAFQSALTAAVVFGITAWLGEQAWVGQQFDNLFYLGSLQTYVLGGAILSLGCIAVRRLLRKSERAQALLEPGWPTVDWTVFGLVVLGQLVLAVIAVLPHVLLEILPAAEAARFQDLLDPTFDPGWAWLGLAITVIALVAALWERRPWEAVLGLEFTALTIPVLAALDFADEKAAASAARWGLSLLFLTVSALLWLRGRWGIWAERLGIRWPTTRDVAPACRGILLAGAVTPVLLLTIAVAVVGFSRLRPAGPEAPSLFADMGRTAATILPLAILAATLVGHALREGLAGYLFGAGLLLCGTVMGGHALGLVTAGQTLDAVQGVYILQLGTVVASLWALGWLLTGRWRNIILLGVQIGLGAFFLLLLLGPRLLEILADPDGPWPAYVGQTGHALSWLGLILLVAAGLLWIGPLAPRGGVHVAGAGGLFLGILAACTVAAWEPAPWVPYHVLTLTWVLVSLELLVLGWTGSRRLGFQPDGPQSGWKPNLLEVIFPAASTRRWVEVIALLVVLLALGGAMYDPGRPYWSSAATLAVSILFGALAVWTRLQGYVYVSGLLINVVGYLMWQAWRLEGFIPAGLDQFLLVQVLCLAVGSAAWSLTELLLRWRATPISLRGVGMPFSHAAICFGVSGLTSLVLVGIVADLFGPFWTLGGIFPWITLAFVVLAQVLLAWDPEVDRWTLLPGIPLYCTGLAAIGLVLHQSQLHAADLGWWAAIWLSEYLFLLSFLVWSAPKWEGLRRRLLLPPRPNAFTRWFLPAQIPFWALVLFLSLWMCLDFAALEDRLGGPLAAALLVLTFGTLTSRWSLVIPASDPMAKPDNPRYLTLILVLVPLVELGLALLDPAGPAPWLHRTVMLLAGLLVLGGVYGSSFAGSVDRDNPWAVCARRLAPVWVGTAGIVLALVLVQEFFLYDEVARRTPLAWPAVVLVAVLLAAAMVAALWVAMAEQTLVPLSPRARMGCVYAAEIILVLVLVHLRLTIPDLFPGFIGQNWAFVLMGLGFLSVGLGEWFARRELPVLAGPLQTTGLFLPLVPLIAFLLRPLAELRDLGDTIPGLQPFFRYLDSLPGHFGLHALLWFLLGLLYTLVAVLRRSSTWALAAALAANFGLWVLYAHQTELVFWLHPQLWLIPIGLILLVAEHVNRPRLTPGQSQAVRYAGLLMIYLSSTADMFITGLAESVWWSVVLAVLSILGVLAGILLRVRAFLFQGMAFLFLVVFAQIWHAAVDRQQTWIWWASGIVLGAAILTLFALFEKRRNDVMKLIEEIKKWH